MLIIVTLMFLFYFKLSSKFQVFLNLFTCFYFPSVVRRKDKIHEMAIFFLLNNTTSSLCWISKSQINLRICCYHFTHLRGFHNSCSWWFSTWILVTPSLLKCQELFSVFWPISIKLKFGWSPLVLPFPRPPVLY